MDVIRKPNWRALLLPLLLGILTLAVFWPALDNDFTRFDDGAYVVHNPHVLDGLSRAGLAWAFRTGAEANWHPLTWLSHMLDVQLFGLNPRGHHLTSLLLHAANTVLLFVLLCRLTHARWRSAFVAALFALHPLHVESVAWVAERKDVLSTLFFLLTLWAYARYAGALRPASTSLASPGSADLELEPTSPGQPGPPVAESQSKNQPSTLATFLALDQRDSTPAYWLALGFFALGLMSKPMLVTVPFVLLLLDYWPLRRLKGFSPGENSGAEAAGLGSEVHTQPARQRTLAELFREKLPFFALSVLSCVITLLVQAKARYLHLSFTSKISNALVSYWLYVEKFFWPVDLSVYYPHPQSLHTGPAWPAWAVLLAVASLAAVSVGALLRLRRNPWLAMGWFWFLGTLVPVIGVVQVGGQAMADRYTYIPSIGFFILAVWGAAAACAARRWSRWTVALAGVAALAVLSALTHKQLRFWRDDFTLFSHALEVTPRNAVAWYHTGWVLADQGKTDLAVERFRKAVALAPSYAAPYVDMGLLLEKAGKTNEALEMARLACRADPTAARYQNHLGTLLWQLGQKDEAILAYETAVRCEPDYADAQYNLGSCLAALGRWPEAAGHLAAAVRLKPDDAEMRGSLGSALLRLGRLSEAEPQLSAATRLCPTNGEAQLNLGVVLMQQNRLDEALPRFREAVRLEPDSAAALNGLAWLLATSPRPEVRNGAEAVRLAERACQLSGGTDPRSWSALDAAYAEAGRFPDALRAAEKARYLATAAGRQDLADAAEARLALYRNQQPFHQ